MFFLLFIFYLIFIYFILFLFLFLYLLRKVYHSFSLLLWWIRHICLPHRFWFSWGTSPETTFQMRSGLLVMKTPPLYLPRVPPASSLTSCCRASAIHISLRIQPGVSGSRLRVGTLINQSKSEVAWWHFIQSWWLFFFSFCLNWNFTRPFVYICVFYDPWTPKPSWKTPW